MNIKTNPTLLAVSILCLMTGTAYADEGITTPQNESSAIQSKIEPSDSSDAITNVVVTGVRGGTPRTVTKSTVPIDVISNKQLLQTGKSSLKEALGAVLPSFNVPTINGGGSSYLVRGPSMRGLSGDQVLVLVNGKRRHNTALLNNLARVGAASVPVDLDLIPLSAIARIEVLRDGAAAQYGSDAIAGVINIILKKDDSGINSESSLGQYYKGDGATASEGIDGGIKLGSDGGFAHFSLNARTQQAWTRAEDATGQLYFKLPNGQPDPREANRSGWGKEYGLGGDRTFSTAYNLELPIDDKTFYSFSTLSYREAFKDLAHRLPTDLTALSGVAGSPFPDGPQARRLLTEIDYQSAVGLKGKTLGWNWDASTTYGRDQDKLESSNNANLSQGLNGPSQFSLGEQFFSQWTNNLDFTRAINIGLQKPIQASFGFEHRWEQFEITAGEPLSYNQGTWVVPSGPFKGQQPQPGLISVSGITPADASTADRNVLATYLDLNLPLTSRWDLGVAGRYEHYDGDVGSTTSGKLSTRYEFIDGWAVRGAISNGFHAPSLAETAFSSTSTITSVVNGNQVRNLTKLLRVDSPEAKALGATPLKPETSVNYSLGLTAEPIKRLKLTADLYQIDIDDRIVQTSILKGAAVSKILQANGLQPNLAGQYYTNAVNTRTKGIDVVAEYLQPLDEYGQVKWSLAFNQNTTEILDLKKTPAALASLGSGYSLFDRQQQLDLTKATPKNKLIVSGNYSIGDWAVNLAFSRYGKYTEGAVNAVDDRTYAPKWITDLDVAYKLSEKATFAIGANNVFNIYPSEVGIKAWAGTYQYGMFSPYGFAGGFYYSRLSLKF
ncbi:TonB-dependent receptor plug domain-containing protein [Aquirhabdus sp.]|uniref:TonB-dependent receptor plug domain-containing protein n=1 Tax=Aquirhabdus sp. TaxID=2824160 RepID=UPI00396C356E